MSYVYVLVKLKSPPVERFKEVGIERIDNWGYTLEDVKQKLTGLYPTTQWEWYENTIHEKKHMQLMGEVYG